VTTALITHLACLEHDTGPYHPESADRLRAVLGALESEEFAALLREVAPAATVEQLTRVHPLNYVEALLAVRPGAGESVQIDADTVMSEGSAEAALRAAGAAVMGVDAVMEGWARSVFAAVRPPGHHAEPKRPMGFCLFNNAAIAARYAQKKHGLGRIAIVDFDVHHGNGTQDIFWDEPRVLYASTHQSPLYPGTGSRTETGAGNIVNAPLPAGSGSLEFRAAIAHVVLPALHDFRPQLVLVSAGFDAHRLDPLADLNLDADDYAWVTGELVHIAQTYASGRIISSLEGGYSLTALRQSTVAHVAAMLD
jgi:acetoin utilization deacetylase AcuC-like enzyme